MDISLFQSISTARLKQWAEPDGGAICVRLPGGTHEARITPAQWQAILDRYHTVVDPSAKGMKWAFILTIPAAIAFLALISAIPPLKEALYAFDRTVPLVLPLLVTSGLPIAAIVLHARTVMRALDAARSDLARFPRQQLRNRMPPADARPLEKVAIFAVLPYLLIQVWGTIDPDAYRNTPWTGTQLDFSSLVGVAALIWLGWRRWDAVRRVRSEEAAELAEAGPRRTNFVNRARNSLP
jgi:hypothetical protein